MCGAVNGEAYEEPAPRSKISRLALRSRRHYRHFVAKSLGLGRLGELPLADVRLPDILTSDRPAGFCVDPRQMSRSWEGLRRGTNSVLPPLPIAPQSKLCASNCKHVGCYICTHAPRAPQSIARPADHDRLPTPQAPVDHSRPQYRPRSPRDRAISAGCAGGHQTARKSLRVTRISDNQLAAQRALDDAQKLLERALPPKSE
jgi:hypothetical protein